MIKKKIVLIAGEDSGDLHGSHLMREIKSSDSSFEFHGIGGDQMIREGLKPIEHIKNLNVIGIVEVLKHYPRIKKIFNATLAFIKKTIVLYRLVILKDLILPLIALKLFLLGRIILK